MSACIRKTYNQIWICWIALLFLSNATSGAGLPASTSKELQQHELALASTTFVWRLSAEQRNMAMPTDRVEFMRKQLEKSDAAEYRRNGMTNAAQIQKLVQSNSKNFIEAVKQTTVHSSNVWQFSCNHQSVLVDGIVQPTKDNTYRYRQFYSSAAGLQVEDNDYSAARQTRLPDPIVWQTSGDSVRNFAPVVVGLNLFPEHFAMLIGLNPLAMHNAQWVVTAATPTFWTLKARVQYSNTPINVQLVLDRKRGNLPSEIQMMTGPSSETFTAKSYRRYRDEWVCDKVVYKKNAPGVALVIQNWTLQKITPSQPITVSLSQRRLVHDFRLIGQNLSWTDIQSEDTRQNSHVVYYVWPGEFPSLNDLKQMRQRQHPGESSPDVGQSGAGNPLSTANVIGSALPFAGGVLCLTGGVWMFKQRKAN